VVLAIGPNNGKPRLQEGAEGTKIRFFDAQGRLTLPQHANKKVVSWFDEEIQCTKIHIEFSQHGFPWKQMM